VTAVRRLSSRRRSLACYNRNHESAHKSRLAADSDADPVPAGRHPRGFGKRKAVLLRGGILLFTPKLSDVVGEKDAEVLPDGITRSSLTPRSLLLVLSFPRSCSTRDR
jgi:hypothetical protein